MKELFLIESIGNIKSVFGSLSIIEDMDEWDILQVCKFAKIVTNYTKMNNILNETN